MDEASNSVFVWTLRDVFAACLFVAILGGLAVAVIADFLEKKWKKWDKQMHEEIEKKFGNKPTHQKEDTTDVYTPARTCMPKDPKKL